MRHEPSQLFDRKATRPAGDTVSAETTSATSNVQGDGGAVRLEGGPQHDAFGVGEGPEAPTAGVVVMPFALLRETHRGCSL